MVSGKGLNRERAHAQPFVVRAARSESGPPLDRIEITSQLRDYFKSFETSRSFRVDCSTLPSTTPRLSRCDTTNSLGSPAGSSCASSPTCAPTRVQIPSLRRLGGSGRSFHRPLPRRVSLLRCRSKLDTWRRARWLSSSPELRERHTPARLWPQT